MNNPLLLSNDINFTASTSIISLDNSKTFRGQIPASNVLPYLPCFLTFRGKLFHDTIVSY